ncbi:HAD family hydrolase [Streptomyces sp. NPDC088812]|uniref:HAD family hydrolase n=1 Tax=Streptomyces sp. NPDC088812 TaxID=3365905 RepID=UPI00381F6BC2
MDIGMTLIHPNGQIMLAEVRRLVPDHPATEQDCVAALVAAAEARLLPLPRGLDGDAKVGTAWGAHLGLAPDTALEAWRRLVIRYDLYSELDAEAVPLLKGLQQRGVRIAAVSNGVGLLDGELRHYGIADYFDLALDSGTFGSEKPSTEIFHAACEALEVAPESCWFIGDGLVNDVLGARAAGIAAAFLYDRFGLYSTLPGIHRITHLTDVLKELQ